MSFRVTIRLGVLLAILLGVFILVNTVTIHNPFVTCDQREVYQRNVYQREIQQSPDKKHEFHLVNLYCSGGATASSESYWVTVSDLTKPDDEGIRVFYTWDYAPDVSWGDREHIIITIMQVCQIRTSLHQAGSIRVIYRLADDLLEANFRKRMDEYERRSIDSTERGLTADTPGALKNGVEFAWAQYNKLKEWAAANAENGKL
jgi:hypothetical protein